MSDIDQLYLEAMRSLGIVASNVQPSERGMIYNRFRYCDMQISDDLRHMREAIRGALCADRLKALQTRHGGQS